MRTQLFGLALVALMLGQYAAAMSKDTSMLAAAVSAKQAMISSKVSAATSMMSKIAAPMMSKMDGAPTQTEITKAALGLSGPTAAPVVPEGCKSAWELVKDNPDFSILKAAIEAAGLVSVLDEPSFVATVFAPTNDGFAATLGLLGITIEDLLSDPLTLAAVLKTHVIPGLSLSSAELTAGQPYDTLLEICSVDKFKKKEECETAQLIPEVEKVISLEQVKKGDFTDSTETTWTIGNEVSAAEIEEFDVQANCPTTVHVIDALLLPEIDLPETPVDVKEVIAVAQGAPAPEITGPTLDLEIPDEDVIELPSYVG